MSTPSIDISQTKRFNLKLPQAVRGIFEEPYDAYLEYLLKLVSDLDDIDKKLEKTLKQFAPTICGPSANRWTLWVSENIRVMFDKRKGILMPSRTHGAFVEFLLSYRNFLGQKGCLPPFYSKKRKSRTNGNSFNLLANIRSNNSWNQNLIDAANTVAPFDRWVGCTSDFLNSPRSTLIELGSPELETFVPSLLSENTLLPSLRHGFNYGYDYPSNDLSMFALNDLNEAEMVSPDIYAAVNFDSLVFENIDEVTRMDVC